MNDLNSVAKTLIIAGCIIAVLGLILLLAGKTPFLGKLPGDFSWKGKNWNVYFPLATSIIISIILSLLFYLIQRFNR